LSQDEFWTFCEYINENLEKGFIWHSKSLVGALILFVKKKDGSLWMCVNYCGLNWLTIKNQYPLPLILRLLDQFSHAKVYTKIDLHGPYNLVRIWEGDEWKIAFSTHYGHFVYVVMPFHITNAPINFQYFMNDVFHEYLDDFVVCYIDDILIFSKNVEEHERHVWPKMSFNGQLNMFSGKIISYTCDLHLKLDILNPLNIIFWSNV
jgi:hypothetical protein